MFATVPVCIVSAAVLQVCTLQTEFLQVAPSRIDFLQEAAEKKKDRAVVLIHGLHLHPVEKARALHAELAPWQMSDSELVRGLAKEADVYAFGYAQTIRVESIARSPALLSGMQHLKAAGYKEIILVGYSAGGLVARHFVEDNPSFGLQKVVQICSPNMGCDLGNLNIGVTKLQEPFIRSMTPQHRMDVLNRRADKSIPLDTEFICIVGQWRGLAGDGVVRATSQWPEDLQRQKVTAYSINVTHLDAVTKPTAVSTIVEACRTRRTIIPVKTEIALPK